MDNKIYKKINKLCNKEKKSIEDSDLSAVKKSIDENVLKTKLKDEDSENVDVSIYFKKEDE